MLFCRMPVGAGTRDFTCPPPGGHMRTRNAVIAMALVGLGGWLLGAYLNAPQQPPEEIAPIKPSARPDLRGLVFDDEKHGEADLAYGRRVALVVGINRYPGNTFADL